MKVTILGSTGAVGRHLVRQALERDWEVVAFARTPEKLGDLRERVDLVEGDVQDAEAVDRAIAGSDAVLSAVGHTKTSADDVLEVTVRHLVEAMRNHGVDRIVSLLGAGVETEQDPSSFGRTVMLKIMGWFARAMREDAQRHADLLMETDLDWTIVRPPRLTDGEHTGKTEAGYLQLGPGATISRADLAEFMLDQVTSDEWVRRAPMVTGKS